MSHTGGKRPIVVENGRPTLATLDDICAPRSVPFTRGGNG